MIRFKIPGEPRGKQRPRMTKTGHTYTPKETVDYERLVAACFKAAANKTGGPDGGRFRITDKAIVLYITAYYGVPNRTSKAKLKAMASGEIQPTKKPDIDNVVKIIMDGLNGVAYMDDKQVIHVDAEKKWTQEPCVLVDVYAFDNGND